MSLQRELTPNESAMLKLLAVLENALETQSLTVTIHGTKKAVEVLSKLEVNLKVCRCIRIVPNEKTERYAVTFNTIEYSKYVDFMLNECGLTVMVDGSVMTYDGILIPVEQIRKTA